VLELRQHFPLTDLLRLADLPRSTFYYQRRAVNAPDKHGELKTKICQIFDRHKGRYGYRRITATLRQQGHLVNHKTVQKMMMLLRLKSKVRPKRFQVFRGDGSHIAPNRLERNFKASRPNEKWVTDVTEFNVGGRKLYLSPIMDLFNGEIVSFEMAERPLLKMIEDMLAKASKCLARHERPVLHSDQGWQYRMSAFKRRLDRGGLIQSMSRKGNCLDNAAMESFFGTLKSELFHLEQFDSVEDLKTALEDYIRYYNEDRIKLRLGGQSPVSFRLREAVA